MHKVIWEQINMASGMSATSNIAVPNHRAIYLDFASGSYGAAAFTCSIEGASDSAATARAIHFLDPADMTVDTAIVSVLAVGGIYKIPEVASPSIRLQLGTAATGGGVVYVGHSRDS